MKPSNKRNPLIYAVLLWADNRREKEVKFFYADTLRDLWEVSLKDEDVIKILGKTKPEVFMSREKDWQSYWIDEGKKSVWSSVDDYASFSRKHEVFGAQAVKLKKAIDKEASKRPKSR